MAQKRKLNRGLEALLGSGLLAKGQEEVARAGEPPTAAEPSAAPLTDLPIESLQRGAYQPRRDFEQDALETLADSIRAQGVLQPVVARPLESGRYRNPFG